MLPKPMLAASLLMMSACSPALDLPPPRIDASLLQECSDLLPPDIGSTWIEYADYQRTEYLRCQERHRGLSDAAKAATE